MSIEAQRAAIVAKISSVPGIGRVHGHERYLQDQEQLKALYVSGDQLLGWYAQRQKTAESSPSLGRYIEQTRWKIQGFMGLADDEADPSELRFDALIEALRDAFRRDETLGGTVSSTVLPDGTAGLQLEASGPVVFCGHLCHGATFSLTTVTIR